jgi:hypothetical protein
MLISVVIVIFALLILFMGGYLLRHRQSLLGLPESVSAHISKTYGWLFIVLGVLIAVTGWVSVLVVLVFVIVATVSTTVLALEVSRRLFKN